MTTLATLQTVLQEAHLFLACWTSDQTKEKLFCLVCEDPVGKPTQRAFFLRRVYNPGIMGYEFYPTPDGQIVPVSPVDQAEIPVKDMKFWEKLFLAKARLQSGG